MFENVSLIVAADITEGLPQGSVDLLQSDDNVKVMLPVNDLANTSMNLTVGGNMSIPVIFISEEYVQGYLSVTDDALTEGRLPNSSALEIAAHWKVMTNIPSKKPRRVSRVLRHRTLRGFIYRQYIFLMIKPEQPAEHIHFFDRNSGISRFGTC